MSDVDATSKAVDLVFSGGLLDVPAVEADLTTLKTNVESHLSVYKFDDVSGNTTEITNAISSVAMSGGNGTDLSQNSEVTVNLDMTVLQSAGVKNGDQLRIEYDPDGATNGLKSKAVTLSGTAITSETIGSFDTDFTVDMAHMPEISTASYDGEDLKLTFTGGDLKLAAEADQATLFASIKSKLKIATESGFTNDSVIADAITSIKAMTANSITLELDPDKLSEYVEQGEALFIEYDASGTTGILQADGTGEPELGRFERGFSVELGSDFNDEVHVGVAGELSLDFEDTPLKLLTADGATEAQQTAKKTAIVNAFTITTEEDGGGTTLTNAVTGVQSLSTTELKLEISQTILSEFGVESGDRLYLNYSGAANVLEGDNDVDVLSFSQEFDANLSELANFQSGSYSGNEFHLTFSDQSLQGVWRRCADSVDEYDQVVFGRWI